jgi:hypothetical protein
MKIIFTPFLCSRATRTIRSLSPTVMKTKTKIWSSNSLAKRRSNAGKFLKDSPKKANYRRNLSFTQTRRIKLRP